MSPPIELDELPALQGRACVFGDGVTAAQIDPPRHAQSSPDDRRSPPFAADPTLAVRLAPGDFIVAGADFGRGDATSSTVGMLRRAGVAAVIARSFGGTFLHAAVEIGLPALIVEETGAIKSGDRLRVDIEGHKVANLSSGDRYVIRNIYGETLDILRAGGRAQYEALRSRSVMSEE